VSAVAVARIRSPNAAFTAAALAAATLGAAIGRQPLIALALVFVGAMALSLVAWPDLATLMVVFVTYLNVAAVGIKYHGAPLALGLVIPLLLLVPVAYNVLQNRPLIVNSGFALMLAFLLVEIVSTIGSRDIYTGWEKIKTFAFEGVVIYFLLVNAIRTPATLRRAIWVLLGSGAMLGAVTLLQHVTRNYAKPYGGFAQVGRDYFTGQATEPRLAGPLGDPNYYAQIMLVLVALGLMMMWSERSKLLKVLALAAAALAAIAVALTTSRGAAVAFLVVLVLMTFLRYMSLRQLALVVPGIVVLVMAIPSYRDRVATLVHLTGPAEVSRDESGADESVRSRSTEMMAALLVFTDHPIVGVGPDQFPLYYQEYAGRVGGELHDRKRFGADKGAEPQREAHNMFLSIGADVGLAGLGVFLALVWVTIRDLVRARRLWLGRDPMLANVATGFLLAIVAYLVSGLFLTLAFERYFWLLLALGGATAAIAARAASEPAPDGSEDAAEAYRPQVRRLGRAQ